MSYSVAGMSDYQYQRVYEQLRGRIESGEFAVGDRLPPISAIQDEYGIASLNTVRAAQQLLVDDGLIRTEQGRGAFVVSTESAREIDPVEALQGAIAHLQRAQKALTAGAKHRVTFDLTDDDVYYVLVESLRDFASRARFEVEDGHPNAESMIRHAEIAEALAKQVDKD